MALPRARNSGLLFAQVTGIDKVLFSSYTVNGFKMATDHCAGSNSITDQQANKDKLGFIPTDTIGRPVWTIPELVFEKKHLIPALQHLLDFSKENR